MIAPIGIGLPVHNGGPLLDRVLSSLRRQTRGDFVLLISDNASDDETADVARAHAEKDARIRYERLDRLVTMKENFDRVFRGTVGPFFMWAAHDDVFDPHHVERLVGVLEARPDVALAAATPWITTVEGEVLRVVDDLGSISRADDFERALAFIATLEASGKACLFYGVHRRDVLERVDPGAFWAEDASRNDFHLLLAELCHGDLVVDDELRFTKTDAPQPSRRLRDTRQWLAHALGSTRAAWQWVDAYGPVVEQQLTLSDAQRARLSAAIRARKTEVVLSRVRRAAGLRP